MHIDNQDDDLNTHDGEDENTDGDGNLDPENKGTEGEDGDGGADKDGDPAAPDGEDDKAGESQKPKGKAVQKRINKLTRKNARLKEEVAEANRRAEEAEEKAALPAEPTRPKPEEDDFDSFAEYTEALVDWKSEQREASREAKAAKKAEQEAAQKARLEDEDNFAELVEDFKEDHDDYDEICFDDDLPISSIMTEAIIGSDMGPQILYHLGNNPKEAARIAKLRPVGQIREIGKLEGKLLPPTKNTQTKAPKPVKSVGSRNDAVTGPSDSDDTKTWIKKRQQELYGSK